MILLTGASGFIGKHLVQAALQRYGSSSVVALTSKPIAGCTCLLHNDYTFEPDFFIRNGFESIDTLIHAGSFIPKNRTQLDQLQECSKNILHTGTLLNAKLPKLKKIILLSTVDVYGPAEIINESTPVAPVSLYGHSKLYVEQMVKSWAKERSIEFSLVRLGHVYGPGEEAFDKLIPLSMRKLLKGENLQLMGTGSEKRSFIFVDDVVEVLLNVLSSSSPVDLLNAAGAQSVTIKQLLDLILQVSGCAAGIEAVPTTAKPRDLIFDVSKMKPVLGREETDLKAGLLAEWKYMKSKS